MTRQQPDSRDIKRMLALVGLDADQAMLDALHRRIGFSQEAMEAMDRMDLGMVDPAPVFAPDEED
ncbi:MAG: hypothetical protein O3B84_01555 [Chloroflexi bacterium]|nr:hypothetical protein [Chloroflexota bacterium]